MTTTLGKYELHEELGHGGFATVYRATHLKLKGLRALKVLRRDAPGIGSTEFGDYRQRFELEAQLGERIDHPNVIRVYDFEQDEDLLVLVMEYAPGGSLADRLERARQSGEPISVDEAVRIAIDVAQGLSAIHALDAVHRDLKPSNILFDAQGRAKLADLGLAQLPGSGSRRSLMGSLSSTQPGTPLYMSPEQETTKGYLLPSSDLFSLGCVLFEILRGKPYKLVYGERLRELRPDVPEWLEEIVIRSLAEVPAKVPADEGDRNKRYRTVGLMLDDLQAGWGQEQARQRASERQIAELKKSAQAAIQQRDWAKARKIAQALSLLGESGRDASKAISRAVDQAILEQQLAKIVPLRKAAVEAIGAGNAKKAEQLIDRISRYGKDGQVIAEELRNQLDQSQQEAARLVSELNMLEHTAAIALRGGEWHTVAEEVEKMKALGPAGESRAERLQVWLDKARRAALRRTQLRKMFEDAKPWLSWVGLGSLVICLLAMVSWGVIRILISLNTTMETPLQAIPVALPTSQSALPFSPTPLDQINIPALTSAPVASTLTSQRFMLIPLNISQDQNGNQVSGKVETGNLQLPPGYLVLDGIPFDFHYEVFTQNEAAEAPQRLDIYYRAQNPLSLSFLIQADWGYAQYSGKEVGKVVLNFENGASYEYPLIMGESIRDWKRGTAPEAVTTVTSPDILYSWNGISPQGIAGGIDLLRISIPREYQNQTLSFINIIDSSLEMAGDKNPGIRLLAASIEIQDDRPGPWLYQIEQIPYSDNSMSWDLEAGQVFVLTGGSLRYEDHDCGGDSAQICVLVITASKNQQIAIGSLVPKNNWLAVVMTISPEDVVASIMDEFWLPPNCGSGCNYATIAVYSDDIKVDTYVIHRP